MAVFSVKNESKTVKIYIVLILAAYLALCFANIAYSKNGPLLGSLETFDNDDVKYLRSAWTLLETGRYTYKDPSADTVFIMPGLTTVLAAFVAVFGKFPYVPFAVFQALLGAAGLYLIFLCGRRLFHVRAGIIAAALMAVYAPSVYAAGMILTESCFYVLYLLTFLFTLYAVDTAKMKYYVWGGVFLGVSALFRPSALLYPVAVLVMWLIKKYKFIDMLKFGAVVTGVVCAVLSPWIIRNAVIFKEFIPLTKSSGNPMLQGTFIDYDQ
ncbi:MAG: glycosyltransferase family 39 protein [Clostridiales bacterium]|jgi:4-amino-4-deoxy-L-arabinose transferase-like glycosyltransferase|nr:glycosyltransferase family 39 protein [Clostridiales bacterium]